MSKKISLSFDKYKYYIVKNNYGVLEPMLCSNSDSIINDLITMSKLDGWLVYENGIESTKKFAKMKRSKNK